MAHAQSESHEKILGDALALLDNATALYDQKNYSESESAYLQAIHFITEHSENKTPTLLEVVAEWYHQLGQIQKRLQNYQESASFHEQGLTYRVQIGNERLTARALKNIAFAEQKQQHHVKALDYLIRAIEILNQYQNEKELADVLTLSGISYRSVFRYETALQQFKQASDIYIPILT